MVHEGAARKDLAVPLHIPEVLNDTSRSVELLRSYFCPDSGRPYTGAYFERLSGGGDRADVADRFTADDIVAVSMLSVRVPAEAAVDLLASKVTQELLRQIPTKRDLVDAGPDLIDDGSAARQLWRHLNSHRGIGWVTAGKLLARKRPQLIPVYDELVKHTVHPATPARPAEHVWSRRGHLAVEGLRCDRLA